MTKRKTTKKLSGAALRPLTIDDLKDILGRALLEPAFRRRLQLDPASALTEFGILPSPGARRFFRRLSDGRFEDACTTVKPDTLPRPPNIVFLD